MFSMSKTYRVVAADDSGLARKQIEKALADTEFELVASVANGQLAVEAFAAHTPDVVLLDLLMPKMPGNDALKEILATDPSAVVFMVSSLGTEELVGECLEAGAKGFIQKPFSAELLLGRMRAALG